MKFSWKILFCTMLIMAAACGASGYFFVNYVFQTSMERETRQALDESSILRFAFETAALNIPSKYDVLPDGTVEQIGVYLENSGQHGNRLLRISDENGKVLYASEGFTGDTSLWEERGENTRVYRVVQSGDSYYIQTQTRINVSDRMLTLETMKNVTAVYTERTEGFRMYRQVTVIVLLCSGAVMTLIACWLTRPIRLLTRATGKMAEGEYSYRAEQISNDEMGQLCAAFEEMRSELLKSNRLLWQQAEERKRLNAAFSHDLRNPITVLKGSVKLLRQGIQDEQTIDRLESYTLRIEQYVEAMSSVQKLEQLSVKPKEIRLSVLQSELQETARLLALSKKVSVLVPSGGTVCIDHGLFLTVAENLIGNAARFAEKAISIQITLQNDSLVLKVEDDGAGYPLSLVQNGPNPFETTSSNSSHFGMGLYSSRILCEKHGGRLILGNQAGGGASATAIFHFV